MKHLIRISMVLAMLGLLLIPATAYAQISTYETGFQLQNLDTATDASVTIRFLKQDGSQAASVTDTIAKNSSKTYFPLSAVTAGFNGSAVIESNTQVAAITNVLGDSGKYGAAYNGFSGGAGTVNLPLIMKGNFGINTWFNVQNTGSADAAVLISYKGMSTTCTETATIKPGAANTFNQATNTCLPAGFVGAATITNQSGQAAVSVVATVFQVSSNYGTSIKAALLAYNGFTTTSLAPIMPLVSSGWYGSGTGIQVQNTSTTVDTNVTISYKPSAGFPGAPCTETHPVPKNSSVTFGFPFMPTACYTNGGAKNPQAFVGAGQVTANSGNVQLVAMVNSVTAGTATSDAYGAIDPATATSKVSLPLIMDRNFGIFTGFAIANVGTQPTNISCSFTNSAVTAAATNVAPGAALTDVQLNKLSAGYVGSAVCTATGGDAKIAGIVNELTGGAPATTDALLIYSGINY